MVLPVFASYKVVVYQLLGGLLQRRPGHQASPLRGYAWRSRPPLFRTQRL